MQLEEQEEKDMAELKYTFLQIYVTKVHKNLLIQARIFNRFSAVRCKCSWKNSHIFISRKEGENYEKKLKKKIYLGCHQVSS